MRHVQTVNKIWHQARLFKGQHSCHLADHKPATTEPGPGEHGRTGTRLHCRSTENDSGRARGGRGLRASGTFASVTFAPEEG